MSRWHDSFVLARLWAVICKEFVQMRRDRLTFAMMVGIPLMQLALFGYAINSDPRQLPLALRAGELTTPVRSLISALQVSDYFALVAVTASEAEADQLLERGEVQFVLSVPAGFERALLRGERPAVLLEADATDPAATSNAIAALAEINRLALVPDLKGPAAATPSQPPFELQIHRRYNPAGISQYNIVPGLMGVILTMTLMLMTALGITRERERGTLENLLAMPVRPLEVMVGKILPYVVVGYVQVAVILLAARYLFAVPFAGSLTLLLACTLVFILANLTIGIMFSSIARNQMQAMQMSFFFFLPSILLSGFMFPFRGMPDWAQAIGEVLPLTHFLRIIRGIVLKGNGWEQVAPHVWPMLLFTLVVLLIGLKRYRRTLD